MKYLLIFGFTIAVIWLWQSSRRSSREDKAKAPPAKPQPKSRPRPLPATEIIACDVCSVHLPQTEALIGEQGVYCCEAHRRQAEG
jgi:uncharacterized protein